MIAMKKKTLIIIIILAVVFTALAAYAVYRWVIPHEYVVGEDEIALYITLDTDEDVGLVVFDYWTGGREYSGGVSNADRSMIKHDDVIIDVWDRKQLECTSESVDLTVRFRIITEYTDPNFENVYPDEITRYLEPVSWNASFGTAYTVTIKGNRTDGYTAAVSVRTAAGSTGK